MFLAETGLYVALSRARPVRYPAADMGGPEIVKDRTDTGVSPVERLHALVAADSLATLVEDDTRRDNALRFAAACGALAVTRTGSFAAMPALADVHAFLEQHA